MSTDHLRHVGIDPERAHTAVDFYESYANTVVQQIARLPKEVPPGPAGELPDPDEYRWQLAVDAASSFRMAGQWALLFDMSRGRKLLGQAGALFRDIGHGFGLFIQKSSRTLNRFGTERGQQREVEMLLQLHDPTHSSLGSSGEIPDAMNHPQQQAYLLVSLCGIPEIANEYYSALHTVCNESPHSQGGTPVGALGIPIRYYWAIAAALLERNPEGFLSANMMPFVNRYIDNVFSARSNRYLWDHAAAPVDVADIDVIGIVSLAAQRFGAGAISSQLRHGRDQVDLLPVGRSLLELGEELAVNDNDGRDRSPDTSKG